MDELEAALDRVGKERGILTQSLNDIAKDIGKALRGVGLQFSNLIRSAVSSPPLAVGDIPVESVGRLSHTVQEVVHIVGCNPESEVLRHPDRHLIIREIITKKLLEVVDVLGVPNRSPWHLRRLVTPLMLRNRCRGLLIFSANVNRFRRLMFHEEGV